MSLSLLPLSAVPLQLAILPPSQEKWRYPTMSKLAITLSLAAVLRFRVSYFTEGIALGRKRFLREIASGQGSGGRSKSIKVRGTEFGGLGFYGVSAAGEIQAPG